MADIFISYARADREVAQRLARELQRNGASVWFDGALEGGATFSKVIESELAAASKVVVLWSEAATDSRWVCDEATSALEQGKLVPVSIDGSPPPIGFRQQHTIDAADWARGRTRDLPPVLKRLAGIPPATSAISPAIARPARLGTRALSAIVLAALIGFAVLAYLAVSGLAGLGSTNDRDQVPLLVASFANSGRGDREEIAMASGITDELVVRLRRIPDLRIGRASPQGDGAGPFASAYRVDGSVRTEGNRIRVTASLLGNDGTILWSGRFDRRFNELLQVQETIAAAIADAVSVPLDVGVAAVEYGGTDNPEAYASLVQGTTEILSGDGAEALSFFQRAVELDPNYVRAWQALTLTYSMALINTTSEDDLSNLIEAADTASSRAYALNPRLFHANSARVFNFLNRNDFAAAERLMRRAAELDPGNDPEIKIIRAQQALAMGRLSDSSRFFESAAQLDPVKYERDLSWVRNHLFFGDFDRSELLYQDLMDEEIPGSVEQAFHAYWAVRFSHGKERAAQFAKTTGFRPLLHLLALYETSPDILDMPKDELRVWAQRTFDHGGMASLSYLATLAAQDGHLDAATNLLHIAFERPAGQTSFFIWHPAFADLRSTDGFESLVEDHGFVEAWRESGDWGDFCQPISDTEIECS